jgi:hypothetical protein
MRRRSTRSARAVAIAVVDRYDEFARLIIAPVMMLQLTFSTAMLSDWNFAGQYLRNLISAEPASFLEVGDASAAMAAGP